jgi:hypothetical protein
MRYLPGCYLYLLAEPGHIKTGKGADQPLLKISRGNELYQNRFFGLRREGAPGGSFQVCKRNI